MRLEFDPSRPPLKRITSVFIKREPLDVSRNYSVRDCIFTNTHAHSFSLLSFVCFSTHTQLVTRAFMYEGGDGFDSLKQSEVIIPADMGCMLSTIMRSAFVEASVISIWRTNHSRPHTPVERAAHAFMKAKNSTLLVNYSVCVCVCVCVCLYAWEKQRVNICPSHIIVPLHRAWSPRWTGASAARWSSLMSTTRTTRRSVRQ